MRSQSWTIFNQKMCLITPFSYQICRKRKSNWQNFKRFWARTNSPLPRQTSPTVNNDLLSSTTSSKSSKNITSKSLSASPQPDPSHEDKMPLKVARCHFLFYLLNRGGFFNSNFNAFVVYQNFMWQLSLIMFTIPERLYAMCCIVSWTAFILRVRSLDNYTKTTPLLFLRFTSTGHSYFYQVNSWVLLRFFIPVNHYANFNATFFPPKILWVDPPYFFTFFSFQQLVQISCPILQYIN